MRRRVLLPLISAASVAGLALTGAPAASASGGHAGPSPRVVGPYKHLVVIYEENHSFDNLYGEWGRVGGQLVDGLRTAPPSRTLQRAQDGTPYRCLEQVDVNLTSPDPLPTTCRDAAHGVPDSHFRNRPFSIDRYIRPEDTTCPKPGSPFAPNGVKKGDGDPGGCTRDLVHRFYQEQYQLDGGRQDRYVTGSDAVGLTMGHYDTKALPIYRYLHSPGAPHYVVADRFFQAAFGGSFLNHQYLVAARAPIDTDPTVGGTKEQHAVVDANGMPVKYPLYTPVGPVAEGPLTQACGLPTTKPGLACGDYAVNTIQPQYAPHSGGTTMPAVDATTYPTIGDRLMAAGVSWNWYSGGWDAAEAGHPGPLFQFHHQPLNYFSSFAPGTVGRSHLRDETEFVAAAKAGTLPTVSFVKPYGDENEHPGYASEPNGSDHLVDLLRTITSGPQARDTLVVVTYDEFGGQWDHVPPPGQGTRGVHDAFGPGTRIPALVLSAAMTRSGVDHTVYDTTSILATIERGLGLRPLSSRDARVADLSPAVWTGGWRR